MSRPVDDEPGRVDGFDASLVPPGVADARGRHFADALGAGFRRSDPNRLRLTDFQTVDARLLPLFVRQLSLQRFMFPGITEAIVRRFCANAARLHELAGSLAGIRFALELIGVTVAWTPWHRMEPPGEPDTYEASILIDDVGADEGLTLSPDLIEAARNTIDATKRWSQSGFERFGVRTKGAGRVGSRLRTGATYRTYPLSPGDQREGARPRSAARVRAGGRHRTTGQNGAAA